MDHLVNVGPLTVSVAASDWKDYSSGVFDGCSYDDDIVINHLGQLTGYGTSETDGDYWIFRNSYGENWGIDGSRGNRSQSLAERVKNTL